MSCWSWPSSGTPTPARASPSRSERSRLSTRANRPLRGCEMANGINARNLRTELHIIAILIDRIKRLERPNSIHIGGVGGAIGGVGYTLSVDASGQLVATSDAGTVTVLALP